MKRLIPLILAVLSGCQTVNIGRTELPSQSARFAEVVAALDVLQGLEERRQNGEALTPIFLEMEYTWSCRLCRAEHNNAQTNAARLKAVQAHLQRMHDLKHAIGILEDPNPIARIANSQVDFYVAEAELWVGEAGKK